MICVHVVKTAYIYHVKIAEEKPHEWQSKHSKNKKQGNGNYVQMKNTMLIIMSVPTVVMNHTVKWRFQITARTADAK